MQFRTDMADERHDLYKKANNIEDKVDGVEAEYETISDTKITRVEILNNNGEEALGKKKGIYVTIDLKKVSNLEEGKKEDIEDIIATELKKIVDKHVNDLADVLIVGLGNGELVADALGTKIANNIEVTRHIKRFYPEYLKPGTRCISAIAPRCYGKNRN